MDGRTNSKNSKMPGTWHLHSAILCQLVVCISAQGLAAVSRCCAHTGTAGINRHTRSAHARPAHRQHVASTLKPGAQGVSACEDDSNNYFCTCAKCRALDPPERKDSPHGKYSDR